MIEKVILDNYKCFDHIEVPINGLTLLAGSNGSGKSTIIHALLLARQSFYANTNKLEFNRDYIKLGYSNDVFNEFNEDEQILGIKVFDTKGNTDLSAEYLSYKTKLDLSKDSFFPCSETCLYNKNFEYIAADRISPETVFSVFNENKNLGIHGENVMNYLSIYGKNKVSVAITKEGLDNTLISQIDYWMSQLFSGFSIRFEELVKADLINLRFQEISVGDKSNERRPINVGFGITYVLPVLVALLKAVPGDLVIIENPECHLHPKAQRTVGELIALIAQNGVQVIVETHSDHILNGIRLSVKKNIINKELTQILFVVREDVGTHYHTNIYAPNILDNGDLDVWPEGFFDEWDNALFSLLV